jgi:phage-related protein
MNYTVEFVSDNAGDETYSLPKDILAEVIHIMQMMEQHGANLGHPYTAPMEGHKGLFEIRAKAKAGIGRSLFCYVKGRKVIILHSFVKKTQKTPKKNIKIALERKKEADNGKD